MKEIDPMKQCDGNVLVYLAYPCAGYDVSRLLRELASLDGVCRAAPMAKFSRVLSVDYDRSVIALRTLLARVQRGWSAARLVGI
jgi:hypothetical protein